MKKLITLIVIVLAIIVVYNLIDSHKEKVVSTTKEKVFDQNYRVVLYAKQSEAKENLHALYQKEQAFYAKTGHFTKSIDSLQLFRPIRSIYKYKITEANDYTFKIRAEGNIDNDKYWDIWEIDGEGHITNVANDAEE